MSPKTLHSRGMCALALAMLATAILVLCKPADASPLDKRPASGQCEWRNPGANRYMLPLDAAVDRFTDIPADVRARLKARVLDPRKHVRADDHVLIGRSSIEGGSAWWSLWDMNGGQGEVCWGEVTRKTWTDGQYERAMVFCESGYCVAFASVCRNIARAYILARKTPPGGDAPAGKDALRSIDIDWPVPALDYPPVTFAKAAIPPNGGGDDPERMRPDLPWPEWPRPVLPPRVERFAVVQLPAVVAPIPEPGTVALFAAGLVLIGLMQRRRLQRGKARP